MKLFSSPEEYYMDRCLALAEMAKGETSPNPMVGAVVLDSSGKKVSEGFHAKAGFPHAEVVALNLAGEAARGGTLYVNLEPCNHTGRTPPCTEKIVEAGIKNVICGTLDPNPLVAGTGRDFLQNQLISVRVGFLEEACLKLNEVFFHTIQHKKPFVTVKHGMTLDGKIADRHGKSQWITSPLSRKMVQLLRSQQDAILTTAATVAEDDCQLTVREFPLRGQPPVRVVLDRRARLNPSEYQIFNVDQAPTWVFVSKIKANESHVEKMESMGCTVFRVFEDASGLDLNAVMSCLYEEGIASVWVEAGGQLAGQLQASGLIQKWCLFQAGKFLPDAQAHPILKVPGITSLSHSPALRFGDIQPVGEDVLIEAYPV
jgi:diaminohydroxyphosphoribosylaminopyrimidine deaminase / 5-amino-6-(5-phosphoribosylamino)uracil reductase